MKSTRTWNGWAESADGRVRWKTYRRPGVRIRSGNLKFWMGGLRIMAGSLAVFSLDDCPVPTRKSGESAALTRLQREHNVLTGAGSDALVRHLRCAARSAPCLRDRSIRVQRPRRKRLVLEHGD